MGQGMRTGVALKTAFVATAPGTERVGQISLLEDFSESFMAQHVSQFS